jgi:hypothetical protein
LPAQESEERSQSVNLGHVEFAAKEAEDVVK